MILWIVRFGHTDIVNLAKQKVNTYFKHELLYNILLYLHISTYYFLTEQSRTKHLNKGIKC